MSEPSEELFGKLTRPDPRVPISLSEVFTRSFTQDGRNPLLDYVENNFPLTMDTSTAHAFGLLEQRYRREQRDAFIVRGGLELNALVVKGALSVASARAPNTGIGAVAVAGLEVFTERLLEGALDAFDASVADSTEALVGYHLTKLREQTGLSLEGIHGLSPAEARVVLFQTDKGIMDSSIDFLSAEDKTIALHGMSRILEDRLSSAAAVNRMIALGNAASIDELRDQTRLLTRQHNAYEVVAENLTRGFEELGSSVAVLSDQVDTLQRNVAKNTDNIGILKKYVFADAPIEAKIAMLDDGLLDDVEPTARANLRDQLETLKAKKEVQERLRGYLDKGQHIATILQAVPGLDAKTVAKANELVRVGNVAMSAFAAYSSGNVLGAVAAVSGLFGGGGDSTDAAAARRHAEIMRTLVRMDAKLDSLLQTQREVIANQVNILRGLYEISAQIEQHHEAVMGRLDDVLDATLYNRFATLEVGTQDFRALESFSQPLAAKRASHPLTYDDLAKHFFGYGDRFEQHNHILVSILHLGGENAHPFLLLESYEELARDRLPEMKRAVTRVLRAYTTTVDYVRRFHGLKAITQASNIVAPDVWYLDEKLKATAGETIEPLSPTLGDASGAPVNPESLSRILSSAHLRRVYDVLREIHVFYPLQAHDQAENKLLTLEEFVDREPRDAYGRRHFEYLNALVERAVAQENLLGGDFLLPIFYQRIVLGSIDPSSTEYELMLNVLEENAWFRANFTRYLVKRQLEASPRGPGTPPVDLFEYFTLLRDTSDLAAEGGPDTPLRRCFSEHLRKRILLIRADAPEASRHARWHFDVSSEKHALHLLLPDSQEFADGELGYRREMYDLLELKAEILAAISDYQLDDYVDPADNMYKHLRFH